MFSTFRLPLFLFIVLLPLFPSDWTGQVVRAAQQPEQTVQITAPTGGEALQGVVAIRGTSAVTGFRSVELAFAYQSNPTGTWFLLQQSSTPLQDGLLASWDTTTIADGTYRLRLQVSLLDGRTLESEISGLRVRNYSPLETSTPGSASTGIATQPVQTQPVRPTATLPDYQATPRLGKQLPTNPAQVTPQHLRQSALLGVGIVFASFLLAGIYLGLRLVTRR